MGGCLPCLQSHAPPSRLPAVEYPPFRMEFAKAPLGGFASSYEKAPENNFAFMIPGDEELFVGGGALNGAVGKLLFKHANQEMIAFEEDADGKFVTVKEGGKDVPKFDKANCPYRFTMSRLFRKTRNQKNKMVVASSADIGALPLLFSAGRTYSDCDHPFGSVFIHVFNLSSRPFQKKKNVALLYTVGALGVNAKAPGEGEPNPARSQYVKANVKDFLYELNKTGDNTVQLVMDYNAHARTQALPVIEVIRLPIVSGGIFMHPAVTGKEAALALLWGVHNALARAAEHHRDLKVELMPGAPMEAAYKEYMSCKKPSDWAKVDIKGKNGTTSNVFSKIQLVIQDTPSWSFCRASAR